MVIEHIYLAINFDRKKSNIKYKITMKSNIKTHFRDVHENILICTLILKCFDNGQNLANLVGSCALQSRFSF